MVGYRCKNLRESLKNNLKKLSRFLEPVDLPASCPGLRVQEACHPVIHLSFTSFAVTDISQMPAALGGREDPAHTLVHLQ